MTLSTRATRWLLAGAFVSALAIRLAVTVAFTGLGAPPNLSANPDQDEYERITYNVSRGAGYSMNGETPTAVRPPGFTLTLLPVYEVFGRSFAAVRLCLILLSACTCLFAAWTAFQWSGRVPAVITAWWLALYPGHFYYAMHLLSETVFAFWLSAAVACTLVAMRNRKVLTSAIAGLLWGLAILTRVELIVIVPVAWALVLFQSRERRTAWIRQLAVPTMVVAVMVGSWMTRNAVALGTPTLSTQRGCTLWGADNELTFTSPRFAGTWVNCSDLANETHPIRGTEVDRERLLFGYAIEAVRRHAWQLPYLTAMKVWRLLSPFFETTNRASLWAMALGWMAAAPFVVLGIWSTWRQHKATRATWLVLVTPILATLVTTLVFYGSTRYRDSMAPILLIFAAFGLMKAAGMETTT